ncbi:site-specific DNA-methyltransferase [Terriglobus tenax]|uniref:site-specific DNA-methyltransferase n=1 Tax=Terriglobus tenax TaxID=1111115 RepID=UPI0021E007BE|nr:site-specific DNA-methyltransferase [Terriglobus tenax]
MAKTAKPKPKKIVQTLVHEEASRKNIPTAEYQSVMRAEDLSPIRVAYERRNRDLDPQLVWRGKDEQDWSDLVVPAPPLYIQEKVHPKVLIDDLERQAKAGQSAVESQFDLFADFNGLPSEEARTEFYQHDAHWSNRMILGDSLQVMASLAERESLRGKVQCIYFDPPYGIKFNSNFQWSTTSRDVKDGNKDHITREPEQVKAFRDTWRDGINSYLTYLRDRLTVARDLLAESGSIFVQIGDENVHRVRAVMDEVFGDENFISQIVFEKTSSTSTEEMASISDHIIWFAKSRPSFKFRAAYRMKVLGETGTTQYVWFDEGGGFDKRLSADELSGNSSTTDRNRVFACDNLTSQRPAQGTDVTSFDYNGAAFTPGKGTFKTDAIGLSHLARGGRLRPIGKSLMYRRFLADFPVVPIANYWNDVKMTGFSEEKTYIVQTGQKVIERCLLMATDPGDLVLDPTCGSGTTAAVAEQWGRRWITIDTSRVALALARARIMGARYPFYLLADSREGQVQEAKLSGRVPSEAATHDNVRLGFVYERVPHITLKSIANNVEIDVIWEDAQKTLEPLREKLNAELKQRWQEWEIPREVSEGWSAAAKATHAAWWEARIARQKAIDASIAAKAEFENLYDKPYEDKSKVRVAGPFTVESLSPHRVLAVDESEDLIEMPGLSDSDTRDAQDFVQIILDNLKMAGVQQAHKEDKIVFTSLAPWPGDHICADGRYTDADDTEKRAGIFIGPEFGTVTREDLVVAAREAADANFDVLIACAFSYDAHSSEMNKLGRIRVLKARMNADLHMAEDLKNTGKGNLFVIFGEPEIEIQDTGSGKIKVKVLGVDVFEPSTGKVRSNGPDGIACWFIDTDYNEESFFVRQAYFLGANDPYKALKTSLKAEINEEAWATLNSETSRAFDKPESGRIAVKVINHLGDEVMKVFRV